MLGIAVQARTAPKKEAGVKGQGQAWPRLRARCPEMPRGVGEAELGFPGWGSKQLEWVAGERGRQCVPGEALWAGPGR